MCGREQKRRSEMCIFGILPKDLSKGVVASQSEPSKMSKTKADSLRRSDNELV
jgi:hypothetical protein